MSKRNPAYGYWSEEETNWSAKDTAYVEAIKRNNEEFIPISFEEIKRLHESL